MCVLGGGGGGVGSLRKNPFYRELWIFCGPTYQKIVPH